MLNLRKQTLRFIAGWCLMALATSCKNFYKATGTPDATLSGKTKAIDRLNMLHRYLIIRNGNNALHIADPVVDSHQNTLTGTLEALPAEHRLHLVNGRKGKMRYREFAKMDIRVLEEVHLYVPGDTDAGIGPYTISMDKIAKIEVVEKDRARTTSSWLLGGLGYSLACFAIFVGAFLIYGY
ncbi:MAG: hypothetical protein ABIX01_20510 [Chitinophagaceae bacterium]